MPTALLNFTSPFLDKPRAKRIPIILVKNFDEWLKKQNVQTKNFCAQIGFEGQLERALPLRNAKGELESVVITIAATCGVYDVSSVIASIKQSLNKSLLKTTSFYFAGETLKGAELNNAHLGWALGCYQFDIYKKGSSESPALLWSSGVDKARVKALAESIFLVRNLVNAPSNDLGPDERTHFQKLSAYIRRRPRQRSPPTPYRHHLGQSKKSKSNFGRQRRLL